MIIAGNSQIFDFVAGLVIPIRIPSRKAAFTSSYYFSSSLPGILAFTPLPVNRFPNKLALNAANIMPKNLPFCSFASF